MIISITDNIVQTHVSVLRVRSLLTVGMQAVCNLVPRPSTPRVCLAVLEKLPDFFTAARYRRGRPRYEVSRCDFLTETACQPLCYTTIHYYIVASCFYNNCGDRAPSRLARAQWL